MALRLLCFSDLHRDLAAARRLYSVAFAGRFDALVCAGDLALDGVHEPGLTAELTRAGVNILVVPGNHDGDAEYRAETSGWIDLHEKIVQRGEWWFAGFGLHGDPPAPGQELRSVDRLQALLHRAEGIPAHRLILATHLPPAATLAARDRKFVDRGSAMLASWVAQSQPAAVVCGHVHHSEPILDRIGATLVVLGGPQGYVLEL